MATLNRVQRPPPAPGYEADFYLWALDQAARLRAGDIAGLDLENLAEEIESLGRSDRRELRSRSGVLITHLLKWQFQPERHGQSWLGTIGQQRAAIELVLRDSPSLRPTIAQVIDDSYRYAVKQAARETGLPPATFPASCPWTPGEILDEDWLPA